MSVERQAQFHLFLSAVFFSTAGLYMGLIEVGVWAVVFWRSFFALVFTSALILVTRDRGFTRLDPAGLAGAMLSAAAMLAFIPALRLTSVANVAVIHGSLPLLTSLLARLTIKEPFSLSTAGLCAAAGIGTAVIFSGSASSGLRLAGDGLALLMTILMALMTIAFRRSQASSLILVALSNGFAGIAGAMLAPSLAVSAGQGLILACFALVQMSLGLLFFAVGSRRLPPADTALILLAEVPLSAVWVWLAFADVPAIETITGAGIILTAVLVYLATPPK
ncbi:DMT family transporter [Rhizobium sp. R693]|uniref:DMT family transporter n=1 Tax=Rhizobium sp. R693 TaxID=1764276 RepID=UPI000B531357|nr:DMT family transporter [Rhizobium sp. R693]OWV96855.1 transporter [Rhizobium sp. R693]